MAKPVTITLRVQANYLFGLTYPTKAQINEICVLSDDNNGNSPNGTLPDFTSIVYINNNVKWVGVTGDNGYTIAITSIVFDSEDGDTNFFTTKIIQGSSGRSGNVNANVKNDNRLAGLEDIYLINFSIYDSPSNFKSFSIDPKLAINP